jgi:ubiquitin carboxyl-terminal hydrolase 9/13
MVEPVDKHFVRNFFGDKPGMATAYVLFYQETTFEKVREEQIREGMEEVMLANQAANLAAEGGEKQEKTEPLKRQATQPTSPAHDPSPLSGLARASTTPDMFSAPPGTSRTGNIPPVPSTPLSQNTTAEKAEAKSEVVTKEDKKREKKEREAAEKAKKQAEKQADKDKKDQAKLEEKKRLDERLQNMKQRQKEDEDLAKVLEESRKSAVKEDNGRKPENGEASPSGTFGFLNRSKRGSKSISGKSMAKRSVSFFGGRDKDEPPASEDTNGTTPETKDSRMGRLSSTLGRKKSSNMLS